VCARLTEEIFDTQEFPSADTVTVTSDTVRVESDGNDEAIRVYMRDNVLWYEPS
jgi:hypothetical protein